LFDLGYRAKQRHVHGLFDLGYRAKQRHVHGLFDLNYRAKQRHVHGFVWLARLVLGWRLAGFSDAAWLYACIRFARLAW